jgi:Zn-dependent protease
MPERRATLCTSCGTEIAAGLYACPACHRLLHADQLNLLAHQARTAAAAGNLSDALAHWRGAQDLLPPQSRQHALIGAEIVALSERVEAGGLVGQPPVAAAKTATSPATRGRFGKLGGLFGAIALVLWKFKAAAIFLLTKGKLLLMGLTNVGTSLSMLASFGFYWGIWGWKFAAGLVLSIYLHEMGHVIALQRYGIKATAPMFIPGLGAMIRLKQYPRTPREEARVGLAGPIAGLGAAVASYGLFWITGAPIFAAIAKFGGLINLFNMMPVLSLDGSHAFVSLTRWQRWACVAALVGMWRLSGEGLLALIVIVALIRSLASRGSVAADSWTLTTYVFLTVTLSALTMIPVRI